MTHSGKHAPAKRSCACPICAARQPGTTEVYVISESNDRYFFNVDKAKAIVTDERPSLELGEATIKRMMLLNAWEESHLPHVDAKRPGILVQRFGGLILLDGIHRAVRSLREEKAFRAYMLNYEESLACIVRQDIASSDAIAIVEKLRRVLGTAPRSDRIEAEIECSPATLARVQMMLQPEEKQRFTLRAVPPYKHHK